MLLEKSGENFQYPDNLASLQKSRKVKSGSMRAVVQRVSQARVSVEGEVTGAIDSGFVVLLGVAEDDTQDDVVYMANKVAGLRIFEDNQGKMNLALSEVQGEILVVSQFTLLGDCRKGNRPSFVKAADAEKGNSLYQSVIAELKGRGMTVKTGRFQKQMNVELANDGPVTLLIDSKKTF